MEKKSDYYVKPGICYRICYWSVTLVYLLGITGWAVLSALLATWITFFVVLGFFWVDDFDFIAYWEAWFSKLAMLGLFPMAEVYTHIVVWLYRNEEESIAKKLSKYYKQIAISNDQAGNTYLQHMLNDIFIYKEKGYLYGNPDDTISYVTGMNWKLKTLRPAGKLFAFFLNLFERDHIQKTIDYYTPKEGETYWQYLKRAWKEIVLS